jgi:hypothetical protein
VNPGPHSAASAAPLLAGLRPLRRSVRQAAWLQALCLGGMALAAGGMLAVALAQLGWRQAAHTVCVLTLPTLGLAAIGFWGWLRGRPTPTKLVALAERLCPQVGSALSSAQALQAALLGESPPGPATLAQQAAQQQHKSPSRPAVLAQQAAQQRKSPPWSAALAQQHINAAQAEVSRHDFVALHRQALRPRLQRCAGLLGTALLLSTGILKVFPEGRAFVWQQFGPETAQRSETPLVGDINLTYHYPAYTGLADSTVTGADGSMAAVAGTGVTFEAISEGEVVAASLHMVQNHGAVDPQDAASQDAVPQAMALQVEAGRTLRGQLTLLHSGAYTVRLQRKDGSIVQEANGHAMVALEDAYPKVVIDAPRADLTVTEGSQLTVLWHATDDFGVGEVNLVLADDSAAAGVPSQVPSSPEGQVGDTGNQAGSYPTTAPDDPAGAQQRPHRTGPTRILLYGGSSEEPPQKRLEQSYVLQITKGLLTPGVPMRMTVEAVDNDAQGGPKKTVSAERRVTLFSAEVAHEKLLGKQQEIVDALVDLLADYLEARPYKEVMVRLAGLHQALQEHVADLHKDTLSEATMVGAYVHLLGFIKESQQSRLALGTRPPAQTAERLATLNARDTPQLEKDIIYLDDLLAVTRIDLLKRTAKTLLATQGDLQKLLQQLKESPDPALKAELRQRIGALKQQMVDLLSKMATLKKALPGEYRNVEAAAMAKLDDALGRLNKNLQDGDLDAAAKELELLANKLENMANALDEAKQEYGGERYSAQRQALQKFSKEFSSLIEDQNALQAQSTELRDASRKKALQQQSKSAAGMADLLGQLRGHAQRATQEVRTLRSVVSLKDFFEPEARELSQELLNLQLLFKQQDLREASGLVVKLLLQGQALQAHLPTAAGTLGAHRLDCVRANEAAHSAVHALAAAAALLEKTFANAKAYLTPAQLQALQQVAEKQKALQGTADKLTADMQKLGQEMPLLGDEAQATLNSAGGSMQQAAHDVEAGALGEGVQRMRQAKEKLSQLRDALDKSAQGTGSGGGMPLPLGTGAKPGEAQTGSGGGSDTQQEVAIPRAAPRPAGPRFRQELNEAAKRRSPLHFEEAVRHYYEELIR